MRLLIVDNFDSFTYNLVHYFEQLVDEVIVYTNVSVELADLKSYDAVVLSPGPGLPRESGKLLAVVRECNASQIPMLGVCLGMQALAIDSGNTVYNQQLVKHGIQETVIRKGTSKLFQNLPDTFLVGLYHSWAVELHESSSFVVTGVSENGIIMAIEHPEKHIYGVQFHPESVLTPYGFQLLENFVALIKID